MNFINIFKSRSKNFWFLESFTSLFFIGASITSIFIPIILLKIGFSLNDVILYYIIYNGLDVLLNFLSKNLLEKFGPKTLYFFAILFLTIFYSIYAFILNGPEWNILLLMALFAALFDSFFYLAYYYGTIESTKKVENIKVNNIIINTVANISFLSGPLIGAGIIFLTENENYLFYTSLIFFLISTIPLYFYKLNHKVKGAKIEFKKFFSDVKNKKNFSTLAFYQVTQGAEAVLFPIYIYLIFQELDSIALFSIISTLAMFLTTFISGSIKKVHREKTIIIASIFLIFIWLGRIFFQNELWIFLSIALTQIFLIFIYMPLDTNIFRHGKETNPVLTAFYKNTISMFAKFIFYLFLFIIISFLDIKSSFWIIIIILLIIIIINIFYLKWKKKNFKTFIV